MRRLLVLILVLGFVSTVSAEFPPPFPIWFDVDSTDQKAYYQGSDIITINIETNTHLKSFSLDILATAGTATGPGLVYPPFFNFPGGGTLVNSGGLLLDFCGGSNAPDRPVSIMGEIVFSFEYHVPDVEVLETITIYDSELVSSRYFQPPVEDVYDLSIQVVPEPATISLLALGGLMLRRKRRT